MTTAAESLDAFCTASRCGWRVKASGGKQRHVSEAIGTIAWYESIRSALAPNGGVTAVETRVKQLFACADAPHRREADSSESRERKWRLYKSGSSTPSHELVAALDPQIAGVGRVIFDSLVPSLDLRKPAHRLAPLIRFGMPYRLKFTLDLEEHAGSSIAEMDIGPRFSLIQDSPLAAIACHIIGLRLALASGEDRDAFVLGAWLLRIMILSWEILKALRVAQPLVTFLDCMLLSEAKLRNTWLRWTADFDAVEAKHALLRSQLPLGVAGAPQIGPSFVLLTGCIDQRSMLTLHSGLLLAGERAAYNDEVLSALISTGLAGEAHVHQWHASESIDASSPLPPIRVNLDWP